MDTVKRSTLIALTLCVVMLASVRLGIVTAKQATITPQEGNSPTYQYNVTLAGKAVGTLKIDTTNPSKPTYVFNGKGVTKGTTYHLYYLTSAMPPTGSYLGSVVANNGGNVHKEGIWGKLPADAKANPLFVLSTAAPNSGNANDYTPPNAVLTRQVVARESLSPADAADYTYRYDASQSTCAPGETILTCRLVAQNV